jgi:methyl-accepting chemotaxis protein
MNDTAVSIISSIAHKIDLEQFNTLQTGADMEKNYYVQLRTYLNEIREATGLKYLYTMRKTKDNQYIYVVDGIPQGDPDESLLGDAEEDLSDKMLLSFEGNQTFEMDHSQEWGSLISVYVPLKDSAGKTVGVIGADFDATTACLLS